MTNRPGPLARLRGLRRRRATALRIAVAVVLAALAVTPWLARTTADLARQRAALAGFEAIDPLLAGWSARLRTAAAGLDGHAGSGDRAALVAQIEQALSVAPLDGAARERLGDRLAVAADAGGSASAAREADDELVRIAAALDRLALSESARDARRRELRLALATAADRRLLAGIVDIVLKGVVLALLLYAVWRAREWEG